LPLVLLPSNPISLVPSSHPFPSIGPSHHLPSLVNSSARHTYLVPHVPTSLFLPPARFVPLRCSDFACCLTGVVARSSPLNIIKFSFSESLSHRRQKSNARLFFSSLKSISNLRAIPPTATVRYCRLTHPFKFLFLCLDHLSHFPLHVRLHHTLLSQTSLLPATD
jgi:hypothetical protein